MSKNLSWFLIETEQEYNLAAARFEEIKKVPKNTPEHKEKNLLVHLITEYENKMSELPEVDPIEMIKIRMEDFGFKPADLAIAYGDKGTISPENSSPSCKAGHLPLPLRAQLCNYRFHQLYKILWLPYHPLL